MNKSIIKNLATIIIVAAVASGVTYSYLSNPAKVEGNSFTTGSADLKIKMPNDGCPDWSDSCPGKNWTAVYPGWNDSYDVYLKNESSANISLEVIPFIEETGSNQDLWNKSYMEITWSDGSHSTGRYSMADWKTNSAIKLVPTLAQGQEAGPWVVKFDIDPAAGNEIANAHIGFNVVFDGVQAGGSGAQGCTPSSEVCDGVDNDCNGVIDDGNPGSGGACSTDFFGICSGGIQQCQGGNLVCIQSIFSSPEVCNGLDDNCDAQVDELLGGDACDGGDTDLCMEGISSCAIGSPVCSDNTGSTVDLCNGSDDDCDPASADGSEDPQNGAACDGSDSDLCLEGTRSCIGGGVLACSDASGGTLDVCNGLNDDCDGASADGSEDPQNGTACDGPDNDLCMEGIKICTGGGLSCTDMTGTNPELCNGIDDDCDGQVDESCI